MSNITKLLYITSVFKIFNMKSSLILECRGNHLSTSLKFATSLTDVRKVKYLNFKKTIIKVC